MSYPLNKPLPAGTYQWKLTLTGPGVRQPLYGEYRVQPGVTRTGIEILEELRVMGASRVGIPIHSAGVDDFTLHN
ncbi:hypothetical protein [Streptomyces griseofuscus]|uniref:Uncharacterized protein n=1 Tax=Streptomyces griseofuscus TaxID=146922 RepID=A0A3R8RWM7_9ACTN|nr:hypothetical protein [Streptomyces griseofuscus]RRQ81542.1 hypothetical protein CQW44_30540 [Streptomyces griseofuscus]